MLQNIPQLHHCRVSRFHMRGDLQKLLKGGAVEVPKCTVELWSWQLQVVHMMSIVYVTSALFNVLIFSIPKPQLWETEHPKVESAWVGNHTCVGVWTCTGVKWVNSVKLVEFEVKFSHSRGHLTGDIIPNYHASNLEVDPKRRSYRNASNLRVLKINVRWYKLITIERYHRATIGQNRNWKKRKYFMIFSLISFLYLYILNQK